MDHPTSHAETVHFHTAHDQDLSLLRSCRQVQLMWPKGLEWEYWLASGSAPR